jgi:ankyrin repeat protein
LQKGNNDIDLVKHIIRAGANVSIPNKDGKTPLEIATNQKYSDIIAAFNEPGNKGGSKKMSKSKTKKTSKKQRKTMRNKK